MHVAVMRRLLSAAVVLASLIATPGALAWTWPVDGPVLRPFSIGTDPYAGGQHRGIDIAAELGRAVVAPAAGAVSFAGVVPGSGHVITITTADGYAVTLLQLGSTGAARGDTVTEGAEVGMVGESSDAVTLAATRPSRRSRRQRPERLRRPARPAAGAAADVAAAGSRTTCTGRGALRSPSL